MNSTVEETNLMCIYSTGSRADLLWVLAEMQTLLQSDEDFIAACDDLKTDVE